MVFAMGVVGVEVVEYDERWPKVFKELCDTVGPALDGVRKLARSCIPSLGVIDFSRRPRFSRIKDEVKSILNQIPDL